MGLKFKTTTLTCGCWTYDLCFRDPFGNYLLHVAELGPGSDTTVSFRPFVSHPVKSPGCPIDDVFVPLST
jgi:hypothetical protein